MAGLFGIFGGKPRYIDEIASSTSASEEKQEAFFLEPDEAVSLGNVEFMRKPKTIKHTFPKTLSGPAGETIKAVSSVQEVKLKTDGSSNGSNLSPDPVSPPSSVNDERRSSDNNLDMFRKMARDLKK